MILWAGLITSALGQRINAGDRQAFSTKPFTIQSVANFNMPWAIAFLPDGGMLITEKPGSVFLVAQSGRKMLRAPHADFVLLGVWTGTLA